MGQGSLVIQKIFCRTRATSSVARVERHVRNSSKGGVLSVCHTVINARRVCCDEGKHHAKDHTSFNTPRLESNKLHCPCHRIRPGQFYRVHVFTCLPCVMVHVDVAQVATSASSPSPLHS